MKRFGTLLGVLGIAAVVLISYNLWAQHRRELRSRLLLEAEVAIGDSSTSVKNLLGEPDIDLPNSELKPASGTCVSVKSVRGWRYFTGGDGGPYLFVYFDGEGHVTCVERGFIAI